MNTVVRSGPRGNMATGATVVALAIAGTSGFIVSGTTVPIMRPQEHTIHWAAPLKAYHHAAKGTETSPRTAESEDRNSTSSTGSLVRDVKSIGSYTWDQVAKLFGVSRRTVHFWASDGKMSAQNEEALFRVLDDLHRIEEIGSGNRLEFLSLLDKYRAKNASLPSDINRSPSVYR